MARGPLIFRPLLTRWVPLLAIWVWGFQPVTPVFAIDGDPLRLILAKTLTHDDNVFRAPAAFAPVSDTITSTSVGLTLDTHLSLQHVHLEAFSNSSLYDRLRYLNNTGSRYQAAWQGQLGDSLRIEASWNRGQSLAGFADFRSTIKNVVTTENDLLRLQYLITPDWSLIATGAHGSNINGTTANAASDSRTDSGELGLQYDSPLGNHIGIVARETKGRHPNLEFVPGFSLVDNSYREKDLEVNVRWAPNIVSQLGFSVSKTRRDHKDIPQRNFSGTIASVSYDWIPSTMAAINIYLRRDLGAQDIFLANYAVTRSIGIAPRWSPTQQITVQARAERRLREFGGDPRFVISNASIPTDTTNSFSLSAQYAATPAVLLSLFLQHDARASTDPTLPYESNTASMTAQLVF